MAAVALVTGAAQGLGEAIARALAADGMHVVAADISGEGAARVASEIGGTPATLDVREIAAMRTLVASLQREHGSIDVLVNNAALTVNESLWEIDEAGWDDVLAVNLRGVFFGCQLVGPVMREQGSGRIVNLASLAGQQGGSLAGAHYAASKAGIVVVTKMFARELAGHGVTVNAVSPAAIDGPMMQRLPREQIDGFAAAIPVGRVGRPEEVGALVSFLCSQRAGYITGTTLDINGGIFMR